MRAVQHFGGLNTSTQLNITDAPSRRRSMRETNTRARLTGVVPPEFSTASESIDSLIREVTRVSEENETSTKI